MKKLLVLLIFIFCLISTLTAQNEISCYLPDEFGNGIMSIKASKAMATKGSLTEIFIVAVDSGASTQIPSWYNTVIGDLHDFFYQSTFGDLNYNAIVLKKDANHAFEMPEYYLPFHGGCEHVHKETNVEAVIDSADKVYNFNDYDFDSDGQVEIHFTSIGPGNGGIGVPCWTFTTNDTDSYGNYIDVVISAQSRGSNRTAYIGVIYHENGHALFNFPDMDHSGLNYWPHHGVGGFDIMSQVWGFKGIPSIYNPLFRDDRNWFTPTPITGNLNDAELHEFQKTGQCYVYSPSSLPPHALNYQRFYITYHDWDELNNFYYSEWPYKDKNKGGVMIWHTKDDTVTKSGSYSNWRVMDVDIEAAHGKYIWTETTDTCVNTYVPNALTGRDSLEIRKVRSGKVVSGGPYYGKDVGSASIFYTPDENNDFAFYTNPNSNFYINSSSQFYAQSITSGLSVKNVRMVGSQILVDFNINDGTVSDDATIHDGTWYINHSITVNSGVTLTIEPGTILKFASNASISVIGTLVAEGTSSNHITFDRSGTSGTWGGIYLSGTADANFEYCDIKYADTGVELDNCSAEFNHTKIANCPIGIWGDGSSSIELYDCEITSSEDYSLAGDYGSDLRLDYSLISNDPYSDYSYGVIVGGEIGAKYCQFCDAGYGFFILSGAWADLGEDVQDSETGFNNIINNTGYAIFTFEDIIAQNNYWGGDEPENFGGGGEVDYDPWLEEEDDGNPYSAHGFEPVPVETISLDDYTLYKSGNSQFRAKSFSNACTIFEQLISLFPESRFAHLGLQKWILAKYKLEQKNEVLPYLNKLKDTKSSSLLGHIDKLEIIVNRKLNNPSAALQIVNEFKNESKSDPDLSFAKYQEGLIYKNDLKNPKEAESVFLEFITQYPNDYRIPMVRNQLKNITKGEYYSPPDLKKQTSNYEQLNHFSLSKPYPNPFNPSTTIKYALPKSSNIQCTVFNSIGQKIKAFNWYTQPAGNHTITWNGTNEHGIEVPSGVYILTFAARSLEGDYKVYNKSLKMILLK